MNEDAGMDQEATNEDLVPVFAKPTCDDEAPLPEEMLWASPVDAGEGGGTYRLRHAAMTMPLTMDDVVSCRLDGRGRLRVVGIASASHRMHTAVVAPMGVPREEIETLVMPWTSGTDGYTWFTERLLVTSWATGMTVEAVDDILVSDVDSRPEWSVLGLAEPHERTTEALARLVDFDLDAQPPAGHEDGYWAPDDPTWERLGVTDPEQLAAIQALAVGDPRIVPAVRSGRHADVLVLMDRLNTPPEDLARLDRPLFS